MNGYLIFHKEGTVVMESPNDEAAGQSAEQHRFWHDLQDARLYRVVGTDKMIRLPIPENPEG